MVLWFPHVAAKYVISTRHVVCLPLHALLMYKADSPRIGKPNINVIECC